MKRNKYSYSIKKIVLLLMIVMILIIVFYNMISNIPGFLSAGYARYKIQELELQNDILLMQLGMSREKINALSKNVTKNIKNDENDCDIRKLLPACETIHVAMVCANYKSSSSVVTLFKSILFYRKHPLHFHIMVDDVAENILGELFNSWKLPLVNITFYPTRRSVHSVSWIKNAHYSGVYGLLKLTLPKILPTNLTKIIVLDTDLTFLSNIAELWALFDKFNEKQALGLVENQSNWYLKKLKKDYVPWPAIGKGFNTGVILMHVQRLNQMEWTRLWMSVAEKTLLTHSVTALADQDIFNTVIKQRPQMVYQLPCQYNVQLSDNTLSDQCYENRDVKIIHWNSPRKHEVKNKDIDYFQTLYYTFAEYNGNLLRNTLTPCNISYYPSKILGIRKKFPKLKNSKWRTHLFFREFKYEVKNDEADVTLIYQIKYNKLNHVERLCEHWEGPMSIIIYGTDPEVTYLNDYIEESLILRDRYNIAYHIVYKDKNDYNNYPRNILRNAGLKFVSTKYVLFLQENYLPMFGLYPYLKRVVTSKLISEKQGFIVPVFTPQRHGLSFPKNKTDLIQMLNGGDQTYLFNRDSSNVSVSRWLKESEPFQLKFTPNSTTRGGIVMPKSVEMVKMQMTESGQYGNLMTESVLHNFDFSFLPKCFIIETPSRLQ